MRREFAMWTGKLLISDIIIVSLVVVVVIFIGVL